MNSPRERREIRLRGLWPQEYAATKGHEHPTLDFSVAP
jgi:hypothetical protein